MKFDRKKKQQIKFDTKYKWNSTEKQFKFDRKYHKILQNKPNYIWETKQRRFDRTVYET